MDAGPNSTMAEAVSVSEGRCGDEALDLHRLDSGVLNLDLFAALILFAQKISVVYDTYGINAILESSQVESPFAKRSNS